MIKCRVCRFCNYRIIKIKLKIILFAEFIYICLRIIKPKLFKDLIELILENDPVKQIFIYIWDYIIILQLILVLDDNADIPISASENYKLLLALKLLTNLYQLLNRNLVLLHIREITILNNIGAVYISCLSHAECNGLNTILLMKASRK